MSWEGIIPMGEKEILEEFFKDMFIKFKEMNYEGHPPDRVLRDYLNGKLDDEWRLNEEFLKRFGEGKLGEEWKLSEVSLHLLTCTRCCEKVTQLRVEELALLRGGWFSALWEWLREGVSISNLRRRFAFRTQFGGYLEIGFLLTPNLSISTGPFPPLELTLFHQAVK